MQDELFDYGTDSRKLHTTDASIASVEAAQRLDSAKWEQRVHEAVRHFGPSGCILDDVWTLIVKQDYAGIPAHNPRFSSLANTISGRFRALRDNGHIINTGELRAGVSGRKSEVRVSKEFYND